MSFWGVETSNFRRHCMAVIHTPRYRGEALAHVQGESLKANANLPKVGFSNSPQPNGGSMWFCIGFGIGFLIAAVMAAFAFMCLDRGMEGY